MALFLAPRRFCVPAAQQGLRPVPFNIKGWGVAPHRHWHGFDMGPTNALKGVPQQGWQFKTTVANSNIKVAGFVKAGTRSTIGRFAAEFVKAGSAVVQKPLMPMTKIDSLLGLPNDLTITFASAEDLEKYIELCVSEGQYKREDVLEVYQHFVYGFDGKVACLNTSTWGVNHGDSTHGLNVEVTVQTLPGGGSALVGDAMIDIKEGDEIYMDYRKFVIPDFFKAYCKKHGFQDVQASTLASVDAVEARGFQASRTSRRQVDAVE